MTDGMVLCPIAIQTGLAGVRSQHALQEIEGNEAPRKPETCRALRLQYRTDRLHAPSEQAARRRAPGFIDAFDPGCCDDFASPA